MQTGLLPLSDEQKRLEKAALAAAPAYRADYSWCIGGDMPVLAWSAEYESRLEELAALHDDYRLKGIPATPWEIYDRLPDARKLSKGLWWNQGSRPSCSMHGAAHAFQAALLYSIGLGSPLLYDRVNPIFSFYRAKGGSYWGGLDLFTAAKEINETGFFPVSQVGEDNITASEGGLKKTDAAKQYQAAIIRLEGNVTEKVLKVCRGFGAVCFGAGFFYNSAKLDANGVRVMTSTSSGGHAQAFIAYKKVRGCEYVFNMNSHGDRYAVSGADDNSPVQGAWINLDQLDGYCSDAEKYGAPFAVYAESPRRKEE